MPPIIYDVAVSIDGYIDGPGGDISAFPNDGPIVEDYVSRLQTYTCAIMGRATYEFGYRFGMQPGENPYPHMQTFVFSKTLDLPRESEVGLVRDLSSARIEQLRAKQTGPIYLCGGGRFAGALLAQELIDIVRLKRAPILLGSGTPILVSSGQAPRWKCTQTRVYDNGGLFQEFEIRPASTASVSP